MIMDLIMVGIFVGLGLEVVSIGLTIILYAFAFIVAFIGWIIEKIKGE